MIIESKKKGALVIPCSPKIGIKIKSSVVLLPGNNEVSDEDWNAARPNAKDDIDRGDLTEVEASEEKIEVPKIDPKTGKDLEEKEEKIVFSGSSFRRIKPEKASKIIKNTFNIDTLNKWKKIETRDAIRLELSNRIEKVLNYREIEAEKQRANKDND